MVVCGRTTGYLLVVMAFTLLSPAMCLATDYGFGGDTVNATTGVGTSDSTYWYDTCTSPANSGTLDSVVFWADAISGTDSIGIAIYNSDSTLLDSTVHVEVTATSRTRYRADFVEGGSISASTLYFVMIHGRSAADNGLWRYYYYSGGTQIVSWYKLNTEATYPSPVTGPTKDNNNRDKAIWLFYSDAVSPTGQVIIIGNRFEDDRYML